MAENENTPTPPDYAGYQSAEELARGYRASSAEAKRLAAENQRLQEMAQMAAANPRQDIPNRTRPEDRLAEFGIPTDALEEFFVQRFGKALEPLANMANARNQVVSEYPDYVTYETEVNKWVREDASRAADYDQRFLKDPAGAMQLAFLKFGEAKRKNAPIPQTPNAQEMADASLPGERVGESRRTDGLENQVQEAFEKMQKSGSSRDVEAFAKLRLKEAIPDSWFQAGPQ
jgi:hypothetical protein